MKTIDNAEVRFFIDDGGLYRNHYEHCGIEWRDVSDSTDSDKCPKCSKEISPYESEDISVREVAEGDIDYHRHTVTNNGAAQVCLTKYPVTPKNLEN